MSEDQLAARGDQIHVDEVIVVNEPRDVRIRQICLTAVIVALSFWTALEFLTPLAWAVVIAIAEWPLYKRAVALAPKRPNMIAVGFALVTALFVIGPFSLAAVSLANPALAPEERDRLVRDLMTDRRAVRDARKNQNEPSEKTAHTAVDVAKRALGERGPTWWGDDAPDYNRHMARNTPYADWFADLG